jgi:uncharacterized membrane protein YphA (DoxX/SURF4 family)
MSAPSRPTIFLELAGLIGRWLLGGLFIYMGLSKASHPADFLKQVHEYQIVSTPFLLNTIAALLPWFEAFCGLLLLTGVAVRGTVSLVIAMLVPFTIVVFKRALAIAAAQGHSFWTVKFDCGCGTGEVIIWQKMIENTVLILLAAWLLSGRGQRFCARFSLARSEERP